MSAVLLDTTVVSALHPKRKGSAIRSFYEPHMRDRTLVLSFQTYAELWAWAEERRWGAAERARLETFLHAFVVLPFTFTLGQTWATVMTEAKAGGRRLEAGDAWIAASAVHHAIPLLTHDKDFVGLPVSGLHVVCYAG